MEKCCELESENEVLPGFRFQPTDEELVTFYLRRKVERKLIPLELITELDIYKCDPWDLSWATPLGESQSEMYFFCKRDLKYPKSNRLNRITVSGFWKATGTDRPIVSADGRKFVGLKKSLVFYIGRALKGVKTDWMMHEFRLPTANDFPDSCSEQNAQNKDNKTTAQLISDSQWVLCRILKKKVRCNSNLFSSLPSTMLPSPSSRHHNICPFATDVSETALSTREVSKSEDSSPISSTVEKSPQRQDVNSECEPNLATLNYNDTNASYDYFTQNLELQQQEVRTKLFEEHPQSLEEDMRADMNMFSCLSSSSEWQDLWRKLWWPEDCEGINCSTQCSCGEMENMYFC
eukprot:c16639_g1_i1 orf=162-1205(+)